MEKSNLKNTDEFVAHSERTHFQSMLAKNPNYFGNFLGTKFKPILNLIKKIDYEQLTCVGYNPDTEYMEATFTIKKSTGYSGNLCSSGSIEYVRFYLDFHDGAGFIDQGRVAVNVHDIPSAVDCDGNSIFPIVYVATLKKKTPKICSCKNPVLPTLRAILSWNHEPPVDNPAWKPVWGNVLDCDIQLKASLIFNLQEIPIDLSKYLTLACNSPNLTSKQISEISGVDITQIIPQPTPIKLSAIAEESKNLNVPASRFAFKSVHSMIKYPISDITLEETDELMKANIDVSGIIDQLSIAIPSDSSKANVDYEELKCVGLDYNTESLVATLKIKKKYGFIGDLCGMGSKEFISYWIDWDNTCTWQYLNTVELKVHDIQMVGDCLCYSVLLPLDAAFHRKLCNNPNIVRIRGVLSWNIPPSITDPDKLEFYGNRVDSHIQIKPGEKINQGEVIPLFNIIGGIDVAHVDDVTGLTKPGSFFAFNSLSVPTSAPFGGLIVLNGPSFLGYRYKIKITNLDDGTFTHADNSFLVVGSLPYAPWVQYTTQSVDSGGFYHFLPHSKNTLSVLSRFTPGTNDKFRVEMVVDTIPGVFTKHIQMDNDLPKVKIQVDDNGNCSHYKKGDTITGHYYIYDNNIRNWNFGTTWGGATNGTANTPVLPGTGFSIPTAATAYPCGSVWLKARDKTIVNSQAMRGYIRTSYNICLSDS